jgi:predicted peptidase
MMTVERTTPYKVSEVFEKKEFRKDGYVLRYRIYIPKNYDCGETYPLVLFLHGAGERGSDNDLQLVNGIQTLFNDPKSPIYDSIVVAPQCPADHKWVNCDWESGYYSIKDTPESAELENVRALLGELIDYYNVDRDRVYVTGLSMGGYGTWDLLSRFGAMFAAGIPICGGGDPSYADKLKRIPIRTFHGSEDGAVPVSSTRGMFAAIKKEGGEKISYTEFDGADHGVWDRVYENTDNIRWLFSQSLEERRKTAEKSSQIKKLAAAGGIAGALVSVLIAVFVEKNRKKGKSTKNKK